MFQAHVQWAVETTSLPAQAQDSEAAAEPDAEQDELLEQSQWL